MHDAFKTCLENTLKEQMTQDLFVFHLVSSEWDNRRNRSIERAVKYAQFRYNASLEEIDYTFERGLGRNRIERLAALEFGPFHYRPHRNGQKLPGDRLRQQSLSGRVSGYVCQYRKTDQPTEDR